LVDRGPDLVVGTHGCSRVEPWWLGVSNPENLPVPAEWTLREESGHILQWVCGDEVHRGAPVAVIASALIDRSWDPGLELGRFSGFVPMNASVTEDCLVRQTPDGDRLFVVTRQAFEIQTIDVDLPSDVAYLVVRALLSDGTPIAWTSEEVIEVGSAG
jgi:hypothetical protein